MDPSKPKQNATATGPKESDEQICPSSSQRKHVRVFARMDFSCADLEEEANPKLEDPRNKSSIIPKPRPRPSQRHSPQQNSDALHSAVPSRIPAFSPQPSEYSNRRHFQQSGQVEDMLEKMLEEFPDQASQQPLKGCSSPEYHPRQNSTPFSQQPSEYTPPESSRHIQFSGFAATSAKHRRRKQFNEVNDESSGFAAKQFSAKPRSGNQYNLVNDESVQFNSCPCPPTCRPMSVSVARKSQQNEFNQTNFALITFPDSHDAYNQNQPPNAPVTSLPNPLVASTQPPPVQASTQPYPAQASTQPYPAQASTQPHPAQASTQPPPVQAYTQPPPVQAYTQPPPVQASTQRTPVQAYIQPPPVQASTQPHPAQASTQPPPITSQTYPSMSSDAIATAQRSTSQLSPIVLSFSSIIKAQQMQQLSSPMMQDGNITCIIVPSSYFIQDLPVATGNMPIQFINDTVFNNTGNGSFNQEQKLQRQRLVSNEQQTETMASNQQQFDSNQQPGKSMPANQKRFNSIDSNQRQSMGTTQQRLSLTSPEHESMASNQQQLDSNLQPRKSKPANQQQFNSIDSNQRQRVASAQQQHQPLISPEHESVASKQYDSMNSPQTSSQGQTVRSAFVNQSKGHTLREDVEELQRCKREQAEMELKCKAKAEELLEICKIITPEKIGKGKKRKGKSKKRK